MIVGTTAWTTCQGIAHLARDFHRHGVVQRVYCCRHPHYRSYDDRYVPYPNGPGYSRKTVREFFDGLDVLLLFETYLDPLVLRHAHEKKIPVVVMPMYEYTPNPWPGPVALWLCPSLLDLYYFRGQGRAEFLPVPVERPWKLRTVARHFVHNAGHGQKDFAKGTPVVVEGVLLSEASRDPGFRFTLRGQPGEERIDHIFRDLRKDGRLLDRLGDRLTLGYGDLPEEVLYDEGDVFLNAERWNGLSLPLQEAHASGMLVMTTDRHPANTWLPAAPLIDVDHVRKKHIAREFDESVVTPQAVARTIDCWHGKDVTEYSVRGREWAAENSWGRLAPRYHDLLDSIRRK